MSAALVMPSRHLPPYALACALLGAAALVASRSARRGPRGALALLRGGVRDAATTLMSEEDAFALLGASTFTSTCRNVTFGYCGKATCRVAPGARTASCGCYVMENATGAVVLNANDRYLVASAVVRAALGELARGNATAGDALLCDAVRAGTLWSSAGFAGRAGSFSADDVSWSVETTLWPTDGTSCDDDDGDPAEYNFADCDGAPCDLAAAFDAEYDATCACPVRNATRYALQSASLERLTATSCAEVAAGALCAVQGSFQTSAPIMRTWDEMVAYRSALLAASYAASDGVCAVAAR